MQNDEIKVNDEFILHSSDGKNYKIVIYNINYYRPPESIFACLLYDENGKIIQNNHDEFWFVGKDFFVLNKDKMEKVLNNVE